MMRTLSQLAATAIVGLVLAAAVGCGDNSETCGPGTTDVDGVCTGAGGSASCGSGTVAQGGTCVIDPNACQDGTILVNNECVDPARTTPDLEEGPEPNGLGALLDANGAPIELSTNPAGTIAALKAQGSAFVIHGHISPFQDSDGDGQTDPDIDTYLLHVDAPTAVNISAAGIDGIQGAFVALSANGSASAEDPITSYERFGFALNGDNTLRELMFPEPGDYALVIADSRTLQVGGAYGSAASEYYVAITQVPLPTPTAIAVTAGAGSATAGIASTDLQAFTVPVGTGFNDISMTTTSGQLSPAFDLLDNNTYRATEATDPSSGNPPEALVAGFAAGDQALVVIDPVSNTSYDPAPYEVDVLTSNALPLSTTGGAVSETLSATDNAFDGTLVTDTNQYFYDVANDGDAIGEHIAFNHPVEALLVDQNGFITSQYTPQDGATTFTSYTGFVRHVAKGRYYFVVDDPTGTTGSTTLTATSTLATAAPTALGFGTPSASVSNGSTGGALFTYAPDPTNHPWIAFATTPANGATVALTAFDDATAFGRLAAVTTSGAAEPADAAELFAHPGTAAAGTGHVVLDDTGITYLIAAVDSAASVFTLAIEDRVFTALGTVTTTTVTKTGNTLATGGNFFLLDAAPGQVVRLTVTPTGTTKHGVNLITLDADENTDVEVSDAAPSTAAVTGVFAVNKGGWIAFKVTATGATPATGTFDVAAQVVTPTVTNYTVTKPNKAFTSICSAATTIATTAVAGENGDAQDNALSAPQAVAAGFKFYGVDVGHFVVSTNGWLSFVGQSTSGPTEASLPSTQPPTALVAPFWSPLTGVTVCVQTQGKTTTVEWDSTTSFFGEVFPEGEYQAVLDANTSTITFVYGPDDSDTGDDATVGVQDFAGTDATDVGTDTDGTITAGVGIVLTPN